MDSISARRSGMSRFAAGQRAYVIASSSARSCLQRHCKACMQAVCRLAEVIGAAHGQGPAGRLRGQRQQGKESGPVERGHTQRSRGSES